MAPRVWSLLVLSRLLKGGYSTSDFTRYLSRGLNEVDFRDLLTGVKPLLEAAVQATVKAGVGFLTAELLKKLQRVLAPLLRNVALEQASAYQNLLQSLIPYASSVLPTL